MDSIIRRHKANYFNAISLRVCYNEMLKIRGSSLADAAALWFSTEDNKSFLIDDVTITSLIPDLYNFVTYGKLLKQTQKKVKIRYEMTMVITESVYGHLEGGVPSLWIEAYDHFGNGHHPRFLIDQPTMIQLLPELVYFTQKGELAE